jgi:hypothetical protein
MKVAKCCCNIPLINYKSILCNKAVLDYKFVSFVNYSYLKHNGDDSPEKMTSLSLPVDSFVEITQARLEVTNDRC